MPKFNPQDYSTVDERLRLFWSENPNGRISTDPTHIEGEIGATRWVVRAAVYRDATQSEPTATGYAFEVDGTGMANQSSALENCETSAIGRALANAGYSGDKRANRQEMMKAFVVQARAEIAQATTKEQLQDLWRQASAAGALDALKAGIEAKVAELNAAEAAANGAGNEPAG